MSAGADPWRLRRDPRIRRYDLHFAAAPRPFISRRHPGRAAVSSRGRGLLHPFARTHFRWNQIALLTTQEPLRFRTIAQSTKTPTSPSQPSPRLSAEAGAIGLCWGYRKAKRKGDKRVKENCRKFLKKNSTCQRSSQPQAVTENPDRGCSAPKPSVIWEG